jgi:hypothetical protein
MRRHPAHIHRIRAGKAVKRRNNTDSSRVPSRLAHRARPIRQYWADATLSSLLSPSPATPGSDCLQLHPAATTARRWTVFHLHPKHPRLVAQLRSAYQSADLGSLDPNGFSTFPTREIRPGSGAPSAPRPAVLSRRSTRVHLCSPIRRFPSPAIPGWHRNRLGFSPGLHTPPPRRRRRTPGWGQALSTCPGLHLRHQPNLQPVNPLALSSFVSHVQVDADELFAVILAHRGLLRRGK